MDFSTQFILVRIKYEYLGTKMNKWTEFALRIAASFTEEGALNLTAYPHPSTNTNKTKRLSFDFYIEELLGYGMGAPKTVSAPFGLVWTFAKVYITFPNESLFDAYTAYLIEMICEFEIGKCEIPCCTQGEITLVEPRPHAAEFRAATDGNSDDDKFNLLSTMKPSNVRLNRAAASEKVEVPEEEISNLMDRISQLEAENAILKADASRETLFKLGTMPVHLE